MRYHQDLQAALRARHKRFKDANANEIHDEIRFAVGWINSQPPLRAIVAEAEQAEPGLDFGRWAGELRSRQTSRAPMWPCRTDAGRAALAWRLLEHIASTPRGDPRSDLEGRRGPVLAYAQSLSYADTNIHVLTKRFVEYIAGPLFDFLREQVAAEGSVLYIMERYVRRVEWFDRDVLYARAMADTRHAEDIYDTDLRRFLFSEGINMPFSQPRSASGLSDVLADLHTEDPLVCEVKLFDAASRGKHHLASGVTQAIAYASDYGKQAAYLLIINLSGRPLSLPSEGSDPKNWPPHITIAGVRIHLVTVRALPAPGASRQGKPAPITLTYDDLVNPRDAHGSLA